MSEQRFTKGDRVRITSAAIKPGLAKAGTLGTVEASSRGRVVKVRIDGHKAGTHWSVSFWERINEPETTQTVYIARDGDGNLYQYQNEPRWDENIKYFTTYGENIDISNEKYPEIQPGECWQGEINLLRKI